MSSGIEFDSFKACKDAAGPIQLQSLHEEVDYQAHFGTFDDLYLDIVSPPFQGYEEEIAMFPSADSQSSLVIEPNEEKSFPFPSASLDILRDCRSRLIKINRKRPRSLFPSDLSINHIIKLSASNFIHTKIGTGNELYAMSHPYADAFLGLSRENATDVRLVQKLLSCAEKVSNHRYNSASKLVEECHSLSSGQMNKTQRLVYYFTAALFEKIEQARGRCCTIRRDSLLDPIPPCPATVAFFKKLPFCQITQFAAVQSMVEQISHARKVHVIDLELRGGVQQIVLMQALAARTEHRPIEHFKVTAIAIESIVVVKEAGVRLRALATSLNMKFSFHVISLDDVVRLHLGLFNLDAEEAVVVHAAYALEKLVSRPKELDILMRIITRIRPCVMTVIEAEANVNSPVFVSRFVESLLYCGAYFDSLEDCLKNEAAERAFSESMLLNSVIRSTVVGEEGERKHRIVGLNVWRAFFARFAMVEMELSKLALTHASLIHNRFECRDSCTLGFNGNCLIVSWKGTPICSLSVWKFKHSKLF